MHSGKLDQQKGGMTHIGGAGETFLEIRHRLLQVIKYIDKYVQYIIITPFKPEFTIVIFIHYKPRIAVTILDL